MRLLIVEPDAEGHHMVLYTRFLLRGLAEKGWSYAILTTESGRNHAAYGIISAEQDEAPQTIVVPDIEASSSASSVSLLRSQFRTWKALSQACKANDGFSDFDLIYCVSLDKFDKALAVRGSPFGARPFAGMLTNPKFHRARMGLGPPSRAERVYTFLFKRMLRLRRFVRLTVIDEAFAEFCVRQSLPCVEKISLVPDVGELLNVGARAPARRRLGIPANVFVILLYGSLSRRKGVEQLLRALQVVDSAEVMVLVAGQPDGETAELLSAAWTVALANAGNLLVRADFHDDETEADLFAAANAVWLGYVGGSYGSSGVLYQAGAAGLPVIAMAEGLIGWTVREHKLGIALDPRDASAVADAIERLRQSESLQRDLGENGRRVAKGHTGAAFGESICRALQDASRGDDDCS